MQTPQCSAVWGMASHMHALGWGGQDHLLPGWEVRPLRCPGSATTGDLNPHVLPASSQSLSQLPPLLTLTGTGDASRMTQ